VRRIGWPGRGERLDDLPGHDDGLDQAALAAVFSALGSRTSVTLPALLVSLCDIQFLILTLAKVADTSSIGRSG
jgi:hypothetical protein